MKILIPGGAGYIGSHMVLALQELNHEVTVLDDFSTGHKWSVNNCEIIELNLMDAVSLKKAMKGKRYDCVIHFAAKSIVGESFKIPIEYYNNNVLGTMNLVNEMLLNDINNLVFSSTAAIFGNPLTQKIAENHNKDPINPYGRSKLMIENFLEDACKANNFNSVCFRYFNAAGAHALGKIGEAHLNETHLIPNILNSIHDKNSVLKVFGNDYNTDDGTCVRDYIHVSDIAEAHLLGIDYMKRTSGFTEFNLGNGNGFSVLDVIKSAEDITGKSIKYDIHPRRDGDPDIRVADSSKAMKLLNWQPKFNKMNSIIESAWEWHNGDYVKKVNQ